jgi:RNA 3'-terminal phosphate cyclase (ATP)
MVEIDGSMGEGGGQVLRSALTLSAITGKGVHLYNIRARRTQPGLKAQHLKSVEAAAAITKATVDGAAMHSTVLTFQPSSIRSGHYQFQIGTAGATSLVLQTIFLPLSMASSSSSVIISGGTHVPWSPCFHYIAWQWLPFLRKIGFDAQIDMEHAGFFPSGGGRIQAVIRPANTLAPVSLLQRGKLLRIEGISAVANLPVSIADRQKRQAISRLRNLRGYGDTSNIQIQVLNLPARSKGTFLLLQAEFESGGCCYFSLGSLGKPAERVADEVVDAFLVFLDTGAAVDQYLADQLLTPLCLADGPSDLYTSQITSHLLTNAAVIKTFMTVQITITGEIGQPGYIQIVPPATSDWFPSSM